MKAIFVDLLFVKTTTRYTKDEIRLMILSCNCPSPKPYSDTCSGLRLPLSCRRDVYKFVNTSIVLWVLRSLYHSIASNFIATSCSLNVAWYTIRGSLRRSTTYSDGSQPCTLVFVSFLWRKFKVRPPYLPYYILPLSKNTRVRSISPIDVQKGDTIYLST